MQLSDGRGGGPASQPALRQYRPVPLGAGTRWPIGNANDRVNGRVGTPACEHFGAVSGMRIADPWGTAGCRARTANHFRGECPGNRAPQLRRILMSNLLILDDEPNVLSALRRMFMNASLVPAIPDPHVVTFTSPHDAIEYVRHHDVDVVISDYRMPDMDGVTFLTMVKKLKPDVARMMLSAFTDLDGIVRAINDAGIFRFVAKPWTDADLRASIVQVLEHRALLLENRRLADELRRRNGVISRQQQELDRLEAETPGITRVRWTEDGGVMLD
jgi:two-component system probable response regulator PhcQ